MTGPQNSGWKMNDPFDPQGDIRQYSQNKQLNKLLKNVVKEVKHYAESQIEHIKRGAEIGKALSKERDISKLLEMIVGEARAMSNADGGTLYIVTETRTALRAEILQNASIPTKTPSAIPNVPLYIDGKENHSNVSSHVALTGEIVNIPDVYQADGFDFSGTRKYDQATSYCSRSMLVIPLKNHEDQIIGVLQLLNAQDMETGEVIPFSPEYVDLIASLASQAAVALTNTRLIHSLRDQIKRIKKGAEIGKALSVGDDINQLLEMIVDEARDMSRADAGTLYIMEKDEQHLRVEIFQNDTMKTRMDGRSPEAIALPNAPLTLPHVPLYNGDGSPNHSQVSSYVALTGKIINVADVYEIKDFDFTGPKNYDASTGYKSQSMLVTPLKNHKNEIIGVLQLLNAQTETGEVIPFSAEYENLVASLASQAAVALTNNRLIHELKEALQTIKALFDAFIRSIATAIEAKSSYTGGHIERVAKLTMMIARTINMTREGPLKDVCLSDEELEELRLAAWMHDIGKITTPQYIMDKATKLETIFDRIHMLETRFQLIASLTENTYLRRKLELFQEEGKGNESEISQLDAACALEVRCIAEEFAFVSSCNKGFMDADKIEHLQEIANKTYILDGQAHPYLTEEEFTNLSIRKGTLTDEERKTIENHVTMTWDILYPLPFPHALANVPDYAWEHHEKLDGSGYPRGLSGNDIPLQSRILAIADIFEALTARDRPYREPMKLSKAIDILGFMKKDNHIDPHIYDLFVSSKTLRAYAREEMNPEQIDTG